MIASLGHQETERDGSIIDDEVSSEREFGETERRRGGLTSVPMNRLGSATSRRSPSNLKRLTMSTRRLFFLITTAKANVCSLWHSFRYILLYSICWPFSQADSNEKECELDRVNITEQTQLMIVIGSLRGTRQGDPHLRRESPEREAEMFSARKAVPVNLESRWRTDHLRVYLTRTAMGGEREKRIQISISSKLYMRVSLSLILYCWVKAEREREKGTVEKTLLLCT